MQFQSVGLVTLPPSPFRHSLAASVQIGHCVVTDGEVKEVATVTVRVPATMGNLGSGFDALGAALSWHNFVTLTAPHDGIVVEVVGEGAETVSRDEGNIAVQAVKRLMQFLSPDIARPLRKGFRLSLDNRFPLTRGLGSSAAARVGALVAANTLLSSPMTDDRLLALAAELEGHTDNAAAALLGGVTVAVATEEGVVWERFLPAAEVRIALLVPDFELETEKARAVLPKKVPMGDAVFNLSRSALLIAALTKGSLSLLREAMCDRLHQTYRQRLMPWLSEVFAAALEAGALGVHLSGAGPTVAAWCSDEATAKVVAKAMCQTLNAAGCGGIWQVATLDTNGAVAQTNR